MKAMSILLFVLIASAMIQVFVYLCICVFVYLCIFVFVSRLILAMFQDQASAASKHLLVETKDPESGQDEDGTDYQLVFSSLPTWYFETTTTKPWHDPNSHRVVVHPNDRTRPHRNVVHPKDRIHYDDHVRVEVRGPDFG